MFVPLSAALLAAGTGMAEDNPPTSGAASAEEVRILRQEVDRLRQALETQQRLLEDVQQRLGSSVAARVAAAPEASAGTSGGTNGGNSPDPAPKAESVVPAPKHAENVAAPLFFRIGNAEFTPGGFLDFTSVYRSTNVGSGIGTSFGSIPLNSTPSGQLGETRFSAQNSRITLKVTARPGKESVTGYVESDFLGALPPNGNVTSNSNSLRMRLYWVDVQRGKWEVLGGQSWSLLTPNRVGVSPVPSDIFYSQDMDTNYQVGLTWSRDPQLRLIYHANSNWTAGVSIENPQQFTGSAVVFPSSFYTATGQFDTGSNPATPNQRPDIIGKLAFDGRAGGRSAHIELAGLSRGFHTISPGGTKYTRNGYGSSLNGNFELWKNLHLIFTSFLSQGGGRYIFGLGPDVIVRPDGSLSPVRAGSAIVGFEHQVTPSSMWYAYYGGAYFWRNFGVQPSGQYVGFGFPGSSLGANRAVQEGTIGLIRTFWKNPNYGALQLITQYSYLTRNPWSLPAGANENPRTHMAYVDLRYVLP